MNKTLYLYDVTIESTAHLYGPGKRIVLWCSGCQIRCFGCTNMHLWDKDKGKKHASLDIYQFITSHEDVEGITLHGGEPSEQIPALIELLELCGNAYNTILFTGKEIEDFITEEEKKFISMFDIVKCGPFIMSKQSSESIFMGSSNQRIIQLTNRIHLDIHSKLKPITLFKVDHDGSVYLQGFPRNEQYQIIKELNLKEE
jgi:anaerobic ribonucleoside-triphosphate reductase activating protein